MTTVALGATAIGAVAGWWCAPVVTTRTRPRTWGALAGGIAATWFESMWFGGPDAGNAFVAGFAAGLVLHSGFRAVLKIMVLSRQEPDR